MEKKSGMEPRSFTSELLSIEDIRSSDENIKWVAAGLYAGQADTTVAALSNFLSCMMLFPDVQRKAQQEFDSVIGRDRLPCIKDRHNLPYVEAVLREVLRWRPVVPIVSHSVTQDDMYRDYFIPPGTALVANNWAALHDENVYMYQDPGNFRPERFLPPDSVLDSSNFAFGFGRRACPGEALAKATLFFNMACILATFDITKPIDDNGNKIRPTMEWSSGVTSHPHPFKCVIQPRSKEAESFIRESALKLEDG